MEEVWGGESPLPPPPLSPTSPQVAHFHNKSVNRAVKATLSRDNLWHPADHQDRRNHQQGAARSRGEAPPTLTRDVGGDTGPDTAETHNPAAEPRNTFQRL